MAKKLKISVALTAVANTAAVKQFNKDLRATQYALRQLQPLLNVVKKGMLGLGAAGYAFASLAKSANALGQEVSKLASATGGSTDDLQVLGRVAAKNGAKLEDMGKAVLSLTKSTDAAAKGNKGLSERFARLGIDIEKFKTLSPERQMERLGMAVNAASDQQAALADVMALVGTDAAPKLMKSLQALGVEGFDRLKEKAQAAGEIMSAETIEALDRADQQLSELGHRLKVFAGEWSEGAMLLYDVYIKSDKVLDAGEKALALRRKFDGATNYRVVAAALDAASANLEEGTAASARFFLKDASAWIEQARAGAFGDSKADAKLVARYDALAKKLGNRVSQMQAHSERLKEVAAETASVTGQLLGPVSSKSVLAEWASKDREALDALGSSITAGLAKMDEEVAAAKDRLLEQVASIEFSQMTEGQQLLSQTEQLRSQLEQFYAAGILGATQWAQAQDALAGQMERVEKLLADEQNAAAFEALGVGLKELVGEFERLDGVIENQLSGAIKDFVETGTADMKKLGQSILNEVIQSMLKALVLKPLLTGLGGMFGGKAGGLFSGLGGAMGLPSIPGKALGGPVTGKRAYLVGEKGPELFIPPRSGTIIDANKTAAALAADTATGGAGGPQNVYHIDARGADAGAVTRLEHALLKLAGPGVVEHRAHAAQADRARRG